MVCQGNGILHICQCNFHPKIGFLNCKDLVEIFTAKEHKLLLLLLPLPFGKYDHCLTSNGLLILQSAILQQNIQSY